VWGEPTRVGALSGEDPYAFLLTDPESAVGCAPLADVTCLPELPRAVRLKYLTEVNRWTALGDVALGWPSARYRGHHRGVLARRATRRFHQGVRAQ